eukprot:gene21018-28842_t
MAFYFVLRRKSLLAYAVLYFALFMRVIAAGVSIFNLNDEARIGELLGIGPWLLPGLVILVLLVPTVIASRHLRLPWKVNALAYVVSSLVAAAVVGLDMPICYSGVVLPPLSVPSPMASGTNHVWEHGNETAVLCVPSTMDTPRCTTLMIAPSRP